MGFFSKIFGSKKSGEKPKGNPIGEVTHFYSDLGVAIVKFNQVVGVGTNLHFHGATTDFKDKVNSIQYDHKPIQEAKSGQEVGIKVKNKVREGDEVYEAS